MEALPTPRPTPPDAKLECWSDEIALGNININIITFRYLL